MSETQLTDDERRQVRELLKERKIDDQGWDIVQHLPGCFQFIGRVGKWVVGQVWSPTGIWKLFLIPVTVWGVIQFYGPLAETAFDEVAAVARSVEEGRVDPDKFAPTDRFIAQSVGPWSTGNNKQPIKSSHDLMTVVASTGTTEEVIRSSGVIKL